ncbi:MAG: glycosyltransferase family 2 protein [Calditrichaeota bacterium]|nr:glycosyltransferase family 2 protein [Calditrichota bacterium]
MKLSVIIPVYNECGTLPTILERVRRVPIEKELVIVDDGSTDGSREWLREHITAEDEKLILHPENRGKGSAIRTAIPHTTGEVVVIQDADLEYDPMDWLSLIVPIQNGTAQVVYGSRTLGKSEGKSSWSFYLGGLLLSALTSVLYGARITDEPTCYKMFRGDLLKSIPLVCTGFEFCPEVTARVLRRKIKILELPIRYSPRKVGEGKKIKFRDGLIAIRTLLRYRFGKA